MSISDTDLDLLETLLDGELPKVEADALQRRLIFEPALAAAMDTLRSERSLRTKVWQSMEPVDEVMSRVVARVDKKVYNHLQWARTLSRMRMVSAAAACIIIGVMVGRFGNFNRETGQSIKFPAQPPEVTVAKADSTPVDVPIVDEYGREVDRVRFKSADEASAFTNDFKRENDRRNGPNGGAVLTSTPAEGKF